MKKLLLPLALMLGASPAFSQTTAACSAYINRVEGSNPSTTYDGQNTAILTADQAIKTAAKVILNSDTLDRFLPFASIFLRAVSSDGGAAAPDPELVGCLMDIENRLAELVDGEVVGDAKEEIADIQSYLQSEIGTLNNQRAHITAFAAYDSISEKLAVTISEFLSEEKTRIGSTYRTLRDEAVIMLLNAEIMAYVHNLEASAYCARQRDYRWTNTATNLVRYNNSGNFGLVDYRAQEAATDLGYGDTAVYESSLVNVDNDDCDIGRRAYTRMESLLSENTARFPIAQLLVDLGFTITKSNNNHNYLNVSFDPDSSKLWAYREELVQACQYHEDEFWSAAKGGYEVSAKFKDFGVEGEPEYEDIHITANRGFTRPIVQDDCKTYRDDLLDDAKEEVVSYLNGIKATLDNISLYEFVRPATELAYREIPYNTYRTGELSADETQEYMLVPQFDIDSAEDITGNFNHYQVYHSRSDRYLKSRAGEGVFTRSIGSGADSHWQLSQKWPGLPSQLKSVSTGECLVESNGSFGAQSCDDSTYLWPTTTTTGFAAKSLMYLHASEHTGLCLAVDDGDIIATDCNTDDAAQYFVLGDEHSIRGGNYQIKSDGLCMDIPGWNAQVGQTLITYQCQGNAENQTWQFNDDGTIQSALSGTTALCLGATTSGSAVSISLQACDSSSPTQKFVPKTGFELSYSNIEIEHASTGNCLAGCGVALDITGSDIYEGVVNIIRQSDDRALKLRTNSSSAFDSAENVDILGIDLEDILNNPILTVDSPSTPYFAPGTGMIASWYLQDENNDGVYALRSFATGECLAHDGSSMTAEACGNSSEVWKIYNF